MTLKHKTNNQVVKTHPIYVVTAPHGKGDGIHAVMDNDSGEYIGTLRKYDMFYDGGYLDIKYAAQEGFLDYNFVKQNMRKYVTV